MVPQTYSSNMHPMMICFRQSTRASAQPGVAYPQTRACKRFGTYRYRLDMNSIRRNVVVAASGYGSEWNTPQDAYLTLGLAHCFEKGDDGHLHERLIVEPITANSLECMANGARTSFSAVLGLTLEEALLRDKGRLPEEFSEAYFCENYESRCDACARTWMRPHAVDNLLDLVPLGQLKKSFNFDLKDKRVLNMDNVVTDDDNIRQDISIDVYGRNSESTSQTTEEKKTQDDEEEDELDGLLAA